MSKAKLDSVKLQEAMLKALAPDAKAEALIEQHKAIGEQVKEYRKGAYATAMRLARAAESHAAFQMAYESVKKAIRLDGGMVVSSSVRSAFSVVSTSWNTLAEACGTTVAGTLRGKPVQYAIPASASEIPEALETFGALRQAAQLYKNASKTNGGLDSQLTAKMEALRQHLLDVDGPTAHAALGAALAHFLIGKAPKKTAPKRTNAKPTRAGQAEQARRAAVANA